VSVEPWRPRVAAAASPAMAWPGRLGNRLGGSAFMLQAPSQEEESPSHNVGYERLGGVAEGCKPESGFSSGARTGS